MQRRPHHFASSARRRPRSADGRNCLRADLIYLPPNKWRFSLMGCRDSRDRERRESHNLGREGYTREGDAIP
jgi:hypothetical protein